MALVGVHDPAGEVAGEVAAFLAPRWERIEAAAAARRARAGRRDIRDAAVVRPGTDG